MTEYKNIHDLRCPTQAREFLYNLWVGDKQVEGVQLPSGWLNFDSMSDDQACEYARQLHAGWVTLGVVEYRKRVSH